nr:mucin-5AC isoform X5 [Crassostrea gigas]
MAKLQRYKQISHDSGENGYSFVNLAYNEDNGNAEDIERRWTFDEDEPKFKPRKKRCTKVNVAVALVILAAGGLGIFLIVKLSQDHQKVYTTPQPGPLDRSTQKPIASSTYIPPLPSSTTMTSSTPTAAPDSTSGPPITSPSTSTLSTPSTTQTPMTTPSTTSQPMTSPSTTSKPMTTPSPTLTTSSTTTSTSQPSTTISTATTPQPISTTKPMTTTTLSLVTTSNPSIGTTTTIPTTTSGTNTTAQSLMTTTSLSEKSTASTTTNISSSTNASTMTTTTTPIPKSTSAVTTILPPTTTTTSNVVSTTQEVTTHTTVNSTNNTESAGTMFDASMTVMSVTWNENFRNSTSDAYLDLVSNFTSQVEEGIKNSEVGSSFSHVTVKSVSPGSVVFDFRIYMTSSSYPSGGSQATITISVVRGVLVQVVQNAKANGTQTLMLGTDETKIVVNTVIETTGMPPTTKLTTSLPTATTFKASKSTLPHTIETTTPRVTTTTVSTTLSPCTNSTYLTTTLLSYCIELSRLNQMVNASEDVKCKYILSAVDCVLEKIRFDFGVNCTDEHKIAALEEFSGTVQINLGIDPKICDLPITMTTTKPTMTTAVSTTTSPCTNSTYLTSTLLSNCINSSQLGEVANSSDDVKCKYVLSAVDCVLEKIRVDFGVNCTDEHKIAALEEFSGTVQLYLRIDPKICDLPITMSTTKSTSSGEISLSPHTSTTPLTTTISTTTTATKIHSSTTTSPSTSTTVQSLPTIKPSSTTKQPTTSSTTMQPITTTPALTTKTIESATTKQPTTMLPSSTTQPSTTKQQTTTTTPSSTTTTQLAATSPTTTSSATTTAIHPCMNSTYLSTILSQASCIADSNKLEEVKRASDEVKCNFILSAVDCVLEKIRLDFGITCTAEHRVAALDEFSGIVQTYLEVDPKTC